MKTIIVLFVVGLLAVSWIVYQIVRRLRRREPAWYKASEEIAVKPDAKSTVIHDCMGGVYKVYTSDDGRHVCQFKRDVHDPGDSVEFETMEEAMRFARNHSFTPKIAIDHPPPAGHKENQ